MRRARVIWFTGLSGSGKSTLATALEQQLRAAGRSVRVLDGDALRKSSPRPLGFTKDDIRENNYRVIDICRAALPEQDFILVALISPLAECRAAARAAFAPAFSEIFVSTCFEECMRRDVKGLYALALAGEIGAMIGSSSERPYEAPERPDLVVDTRGETVADSVARLLAHLDASAALRASSG